MPCTGGDAGQGSIDIDALAKLVDVSSGKGTQSWSSLIMAQHSHVLVMICKQAGKVLISILKKNT